MGGPWEDYAPSTKVDTPAGIPRIRVTPSAPAASAESGPWSDYQQKPEANFLGMTSGLYKAADAGITSGIAGLIGLPRAVGELGSMGIQKLTDTIDDYRGTPAADRYKPPKSALDMLPTTEDASGMFQQGLYGGAKPYEPQTTGERYMKGAAEFVPGAMAGPGGVVGNAIRYGVLPGLASTGAGDYFKGSPLEQPAKIGAALVTGGLAGLTARPGTAAQSLRQHLPAGITEQMVNDAHALITRAAAGPNPVNLSWSEALSQVAGRPVLSDVTRHLEGASQTQGRMADFFAPRPQQIEAAGREAIGHLGPAAANPSMIGPQAGTAATQVLERVTAAINRATRPSYDAARQSLVPQNIHTAMMGDELFARTLTALRNDPERNVMIRGLSDRSTIVYDEVKKALAERAGNLANPVQPFHSNAAAANVGTLGGDVSRIAVASDRAAMGLAPGAGVGNLEHALAEQARLRQTWLEPLQRGPLGKIADKDITTKKAMEALFPRKPLDDSAQEITTAVQDLVNRNPVVATQLVRQHAAMTFNEALRSAGQGNQMAGAKFVRDLLGNPQQRANFEAAVTALPHGAERLAGFNRFIEIAEATGTRQGVGSKTAYNAQFLKDQSASGVVAEGAKVLSKPMQGLHFLADRYERWQLGRNLNELAGILTNPAAVNQLRAIARMPPGSRQAQAIAIRLATLSNASATSGVPVNQPRQ